MSNSIIKTYKGFDSNWKCRDFQYEIGKEYEHTGNVKACSEGFHACEYPLDVFNYYPPNTSNYAEVEQSGEVSRHGDDSKVASSKLSIKVQLSLSEIIKAAIEYTFSKSKPEGEQATGYRGVASATGYRGVASATGYRGVASATGYRGVASATGYRGVASATGFQGAASATGNQGAASATGYRGVASATGFQGAASATGNQGAASATGIQGKAKGALGCAILLVERNENGVILAAEGAVIGEKGTKPDVWYALKNGQFVEVD